MNTEIFHQFADSTPGEMLPGFISRIIHTGINTINFLETSPDCKLPDIFNPVHEDFK